MKTSTLAATALIFIAGATHAQTVIQAVDKPPMSYPQLVASTMRLQIDPNALLETLMARRVQLNLKPFGNGSDAYYQSKQDGIGFVCVKSERGFTGGRVKAMLVRYETGEEGSSIFYLDNCKKVK